MKNVKFGDYYIPDGSIAPRAVPLAEPKPAPAAPTPDQKAPTNTAQEARQ
jgi:hypothetical protein